MKKTLLLPVMILSSFILSAQNDLVIKGTKKISKEMTPQEVIDSLHKRFPNAKAVQYYKMPSDVAKANGWNVTEEDNLDASSEIDYYELSFKNSGLDYYGLYDKDGNLLKSKMQASVTTLPEPITKSLKELSAKYPGYKVTSKTYYKTKNYSKSKEYYEIVAENAEKKKKTVTYGADGTIMKVD
jgi:hypothetical protein